jgi:hypothetical protein
MKETNLILAILIVDGIHLLVALLTLRKNRPIIVPAAPPPAVYVHNTVPTPSMRQPPAQVMQKLNEFRERYAAMQAAEKSPVESAVLSTDPATKDTSWKGR